MEDYHSSDSSVSPLKQVVFPQSEAELSQTVIMPAMMIRAVNLEKEFTIMKATLEKLSKESAEKDSRIERQEEHIAKLLKKLDEGCMHRPIEVQAAIRTKKDPIKVRHLKMMVGQRKAASPIMTHLYAQRLLSKYRS